MNQQPLLPEQPTPPNEHEDLTPYRRFIQHDTWKNQMKIVDSQLAAIFMRATPYMESIHVAQFKTVQERYRESSTSKLSQPYISRTVHHQVAAIIKRYLPNIAAQAEAAELVATLEAAVTEADKIEKMAKAMLDDAAKSRGRGNIKFVDSLTPTKAAT